MQNIKIHGARNKRSVQSLIQDSAIDDDKQVFNFEIIQMKKAFNQTYKGFNTKIQQLQTEISKYKQKCKKLQQANVVLAERYYKLQQKTEEYNKMKLYCQKMKRKVLYTEGKYQKLLENRSLVSQDYDKQQRLKYQRWSITGNAELSKDSPINKNQVYKQITDLIAFKVKHFTEQMKLFMMTRQIQLKIQNFLEDLIYITPISINDGIKLQAIKDKQIGKISKKTLQQPILISDQVAWKDLQKSIQKLKTSDKNTNELNKTPQKRHGLISNQQAKGSIRKDRSPLTHYNNNQYHNMQVDNRIESAGKSRSRIFNNY